MTLAVAILAHQNLNRVAKLARVLSKSGVHVAIHVDADISPTRFNAFKTSLSGNNILWVKRIHCEWGQFALVQATLNLSTGILEHWPDAKHVLLLSGDSLPIRPISELQTFLSHHPNTDFIESVLVSEDRWITSGLGMERFTLRFPFSWKTQRWKFDLWVSIQRALKLQKRIPEGMKLRTGSQWWCLSRATLTAILNDPDKVRNDAFFKKCWIPDESYFHTLSHKYSRNLVSRSLVFSKFDHQGKPVTFYDDHADMLCGLDAFFVRKVWHGANKLYSELTNTLPFPSTEHTVSETMHERIERTTARRKQGRAGLYMHGRATNSWHEKQMATACNYYIFSGVRAIIPDFDSWLEDRINICVHGQLFATDGAQFANDAPYGPGNLSKQASIRDLTPETFLCKLVWNLRNEKLCFHYEPSDIAAIRPFLLRDPNANIFYIRHGWVLDLMRRNISNVEYLQREATFLSLQEQAMISLFTDMDTAASVVTWTVGEAIASPTQMLATILEQVDVDVRNIPIVMPTITDASELAAFGQKLKNIGVKLNMSALESTPTNQSILPAIQVVK